MLHIVHRGSGCPNIGPMCCVRRRNDARIGALLRRCETAAAAACCIRWQVAMPCAAAASTAAHACARLDEVDVVGVGNAVLVALIVPNGRLWIERLACSFERGITTIGRMTTSASWCYRIGGTALKGTARTVICTEEV